MGYIISFYTISMLILVLFKNINFSGHKDVSKRKIQTENLFKENILKNQLNKIIDKSVKSSKKRTMEEKLKQAGFDTSFTDFVAISILSGIITAFIFGALFKNLYLGFLFLIFGFFIPYQVVRHLRNKRIVSLEDQVGAFLNMTIKRYENTRNMHQALKLTAKELYGEEPISEEINKTVLEIELGIPTEIALKNMAKRTGNKFLKRFAAFYQIASNIGTDDLRKKLLEQAYKQYQEDKKRKRLLREKIMGPVKDSNLLISLVPVMAIYSSITSKEYIPFMTQTQMGKIGTTIIIGTLIFCIWVNDTKLGTPLK